MNMQNRNAPRGHQYLHLVINLFISITYYRMKCDKIWLDWDVKYTKIWPILFVYYYHNNIYIIYRNKKNCTSLGLL